MKQWNKIRQAPFVFKLGQENTMHQLTLPSRYRIQNSIPSMLPHGHRGSPQFSLIHGCMGLSIRWRTPPPLPELQACQHLPPPPCPPGISTFDPPPPPGISKFDPLPPDMSIFDPPPPQECRCHIYRCHIDPWSCVRCPFNPYDAEIFVYKT